MKSRGLVSRAAGVGGDYPMDLPVATGALVLTNVDPDDVVWLVGV